MGDAGFEAQCSAGPATSSRMVTLLSDWTLPVSPAHIHRDTRILQLISSLISQRGQAMLEASSSRGSTIIISSPPGIPRCSPPPVSIAFMCTFQSGSLPHPALESVYHLWKIDHLDDLGLSSSLDAIEVATTPTFRIRSLCRGGGELLHAQIRLLQVVVGQTQDREFDSADEDDQDDRTYPRTKRILFVDRGHCDENEIPCYVRGANTRSPFDQDYTFFNGRKVDRRARLIGFSYHPHTIYVDISVHLISYSS